MKAKLLIILLFTITACKKNVKNKTEVIVLGTVHFPTKQINADSIHEVLELVKPDIILMEADSSVFNPDFSFKKTYDENEYNAIIKYIHNNPTVLVRPIGLEKRNLKREQLGIFSEAGFIYNAMYDLMDANRLSKEQKDMLLTNEDLWVEFETYKSANLKTINTPKVDKLVDTIDYYQYYKTKEIVDSRDEFYYKIINAKKDSMSLKSYFKLWTEFEGITRNEALSNNLIKMIKTYPDKRIIALTGFKHRSYILNKLKENMESLNIDLKEFYDFEVQ